MGKIREDDCGIARVKVGDQEAWSQGTQQKRWHLTRNGYTWATVDIETRRFKREDWTGERNYRIITEHTFWVTLRVFGGRVKLKDFYRGSSVKKMLVAFLENPDRLWVNLLYQLKLQCREAGVPEWRTMDIYYAENRSHELKAARFLELLKEAS